ncbi:hypothetical protein LYSHEL_00550 [Lysobacter helvus]|uniref:Uncharacterized protein n=2 Tax=Lysobacteraceae TaxID=32033 RepID=A0ABN6FNB7_9GAMM|nr:MULTISPECIES: hypothetical protein [Lysobacter]BCT91031.1 hypothetical protein LYSCAS_00550 [Lysobacter caseinilyticus]BCT94184.1 hypothetical protein LYSHEL_00550 [Lysobacter helvus]
MRPILRWYATVFAFAFVVIAAAHLLRSRPMAFAISEALLWASITAAVYVASRLYNARRGRACALCDDLPPAP